MSVNQAIATLAQEIDSLRRDVNKLERTSEHFYVHAGPTRVKTISGGIITATMPNIMVAPESGASDNLDFIDGYNDGKFVVLRTDSNSHTITVRDYVNTSGTGNINLRGTQNKVLSDTRDTLVLFYSEELEQWFQIDLDDFLNLSDAPDSYAGEAGKLVAVKGDETGLEFVDPSTGGVDNFLDLTDTPNAYTGAGEYIVAVKADESGLEFIIPPSAPVTSVNGQTGAVILDADDIDDTATTNKFATAAELTKLAGIEAGADVTDAGNVGAAINSASTDDTVDNTDTFGYTTGSTLKKTAWSNIKSLLTTVFDALYAPIANGVTNGDSHDHNGGDGAQINHTTLSNIGTNTHAQIDTHIASTSNPHSVTKSQVGLGNVDNTSDATKNAAAVTITNHTYDSTNIASLTAKNPPIDADSAVIVDSAASNAFKAVTWTNIKAFLKTYFDTLYVALTGNQTVAGDKTFTGQGVFSNATFPPLRAERTSTQTVTVRTAQSIKHTTSANMADGFGTGFAFELNDDTLTGTNIIGEIDGVRDGADTSGYVLVRAYLSGSPVDVARFTKEGLILYAGTRRVSSQFNKTTNTLADVTGLSVTLPASGSYRFVARLFVRTAAVAGVGAKVGVAYSGTTSTFRAFGRQFDTAALTVGTGYITAPGQINNSGGGAAGTDEFYEIDGYLVSSGAGNLTIQFAQNTTNASQSSVLTGSTLEVWQLT